jgi:hypothetical protein
MAEDVSSAQKELALIDLPSDMLCFIFELTPTIYELVNLQKTCRCVFPVVLRKDAPARSSPTPSSR